MRPLRLLHHLLAAVGAAALLAALLAGAALLGAGTWLVAEDDLSGLSPERPAQAIVVLAGSHRRPPHAADLYARGLAPRVYLSRPIARGDAALLAEAGAAPPPQEEINRRLLLNRGVPESAIRLFGEDLVSTAQEAAALARELGPGPGALILVTSPFHSRRARLVFGRALPGWRVLSSPTPHEPFPARWWATQQSAQRALSESAKLAFYLLGGAYGAASFEP